MKPLGAMIRSLTLCIAGWMMAGCGAPRSPGPGTEVENLARAAAAGDRDAQYDLAVEYYAGRKVRQDYARAAALWRPLAESGHPAACNNIGYLTYYGFGVPADPDAGVLWWRKAVELGVAESSYHLALAALEGVGMPRDSAEAFARLRAAIVMPGPAPDPIDRVIIARADSMFQKVSASLSPSRRSKGDSLARLYAAKSVGTPRSTP